MTELHAGNIVRNGTVLACNGVDLSDRSEQELRITIDKRANEPRTGHAVDLHIGACHPFHRCLRRVDWCLSRSSYRMYHPITSRKHMYHIMKNSQAYRRNDAL